jgi:gluconolactonase
MKLLFVLIVMFSVLPVNSVPTLSKPVKILEGMRFTEGPAISPEGVLFFTDVPEQIIYRYDITSLTLDTFLTQTGGANGLYFDSKGYLIACAGRARQLLAITPNGNISVLADTYDGKKLNSPNDVWVDPQDGIYFTDPRYGNRDNLEQDGMHVYYFTPDKQTLTRVTHDLERPNGVLGSLDGKKLYVVDEGARKTFVYDIQADGSLTGKELFCDEGIDGLTITSDGNICITTDNAVAVYSPGKELLHRFMFEVQTTNVVYHNRNLYVTTQSGEVYRIEL